MFARAQQLREAGVLGVNERNSDYIMRLNPRRLYPRVDDKALTKELAIANGMAVPELYGVISNQHDVKDFPAIVADRHSFVIKPAQGSGWLHAGGKAKTASGAPGTVASLGRKGPRRARYRPHTGVCRTSRHHPPFGLRRPTGLSKGRHQQTPRT